MIEERMSDKTCVDTSFPVKRFFKGKYDKHPIHETSDFGESPMPPGPQLRNDVVENGNAMISGETSHVKVEAWKVDQYQQVRWALLQFVIQSFQNPADTWKAG